MRKSVWFSVAKAIGLGLMLLLLAGCVAYPDGLVVRHMEGLVVRSQCPVGGPARVMGVTVWSLGDGSSDPYSSSSAKVKRTKIWTAQVRDKQPTDQIVLFTPDPALHITSSGIDGLRATTWLELEIATKTSFSGAVLRYGDLLEGQALFNASVIEETDIPDVPTTSGIDCSR